MKGISGVTSHYSCPPFSSSLSSILWNGSLHGSNSVCILSTLLVWIGRRMSEMESSLGMLHVVALCLSKSSLGVANGDKRQMMVHLVGRRVWTMTVSEETTMVVNECGNDGYSNCLYLTMVRPLSLHRIPLHKQSLLQSNDGVHNGFESTCPSCLFGKRKLLNHLR